MPDPGPDLRPDAAPDPVPAETDSPTAQLQVDILQADDKWTALTNAPDLIRQAAHAAWLAPAAGTHEVSILLEGDTALQALNRQWRGKDKPTNVLSFPAAALPDGVALPDAELSLGDIALSYDTLAAEALTEGKSLAAHLQHLVVHGMLHLQGYDHETSQEADEMEALERQILRGLGVADPYEM